MNFLKISSLFLGTSSVVGGTGVGIYYATKNKNIEEEKPKVKENQKTQFTGKLIFFKKSNDNQNILYGAKLLTENEYKSESEEFDKNAKQNEKYNQVNKIADISYLLDLKKTKDELNNMFGTQTNFDEIKTKITNEETKLKGLFGEEIYTNLKNLIA